MDSSQIKAGWYTPMLHVASIERSITFYQLLSFEVIDTDRCEPLGWARLHCQGGALMLLRGEEPIDPEAQSVLFVMYTPDLPVFREQLVAHKVEVSEIKYPDHGPSGEIYVEDPDGYRICIVHWGDKEHTQWLERIGRDSV